MGQRCTPQRVAALRWVWDRTSCTLAPCGATAQSLTWGSATDNIRSAAKHRVRSRQRGDRPRYSLAPRSHPCTARFPARVDGNIPGFARIQQAQLRREHLVALRVRTHRTQRRDSAAGRRHCGQLHQPTRGRRRRGSRENRKGTTCCWGRMRNPASSPRSSASSAERVYPPLHDAVRGRD
jgi:hypothetical protein